MKDLGEAKKFLGINFKVGHGYKSSRAYREDNAASYMGAFGGPGLMSSGGSGRNNAEIGSGRYVWAPLGTGPLVVVWFREAS